MSEFCTNDLPLSVDVVKMGYEGVGVAGSIRQNYEKYLYPYEVFLAKRGNLTTVSVH